MVNELCEEFLKTLDACTSNIVGDERDCSTPLVTRPHTHSISDPVMSLGSYIPPTSTDQITNANDTLDTTDPLDLSLPHKVGSKRSEKLPCTYFSNMADRFEDLYLRADAIPTISFLDACSALPKLLMTIGGKSIITLSLDMSNNMNKILTKQKIHPSKSDTLQALVHLEIGTQTTHAKHSATDALLWLYREMLFTKELLLAIIEGESNMSTR